MDKEVTIGRTLTLGWVLAVCLIPATAYAQVQAAAMNPWIESIAKAAPVAGIAWWLAHQLVTMVRESLDAFRTTHEQGLQQVAAATNATRQAIEALDRRLDRIEDRASMSSGAWGDPPKP